jgi:hypothetical protein
LEKASFFERDKNLPGVPANIQEDKNAKNSLIQYNIAQFSILCKCLALQGRDQRPRDRL